MENEEVNKEHDPMYYDQVCGMEYPKPVITSPKKYGQLLHDKGRRKKR